MIGVQRMKYWIKKLPVPVTNEQREADAVQMWAVRWHSRHGAYSPDTRPEMEAFTSKREALEFKRSLEQAFCLIKHTSGTDVSIEKMTLDKFDGGTNVVD